jgi:hypothetical protein
MDSSGRSPLIGRANAQPRPKFRGFWLFFVMGRGTIDWRPRFESICCNALEFPVGRPGGLGMRPETAVLRRHE